MDTPQNSQKTQKQCKIFSANVLVAEDNPANQMLIKILLTKHGIETTVVDNGQMAVEALKEQDFDIVFMDMQMPVMNGYQATQALRQDGCKTPIIALTANAMVGDRDKCLEAGCDDYLSKPIDRHQLQEMLEKSLGSKDLDKQVDQVQEQAQELNQLVDEAKPAETQAVSKEEQL